MTSLTASALLDTQASLLQEAAEALPHSFSQCTHHLGYIRQAVYLCQTCGEQRGICSACSIACHTDHEQLELFPKRKFRCDCPTAALAWKCTLHKPSPGKEVEDINTENKYSHNFRGTFCRCGRTYDAKVEMETMIQCVSCEDWYHESCLNLRERPTGASRAPSPSKDTTDQEDTPAQENDDLASDASSSGLPPPLIGASTYDALVCSACVKTIPTLKRYAGTPGVLMVVRDKPEDPWKVIGVVADESQDIDVGADSPNGVNDASDHATGEKRTHADASEGAPEAKRARVDGEDLPNGHEAKPPCLAPPPSSIAHAVLSGDGTLGAGDIFLTEGWRDRWCKCAECLPSLQANSYLLEEEETFEPPDDPDVGISLEELGLRALERIPRDRAIDGIHAFNEMRDRLMAHLRPFAEEGRVVTEADIRGFFSESAGASH